MPHIIGMNGGFGGAAGTITGTGAGTWTIWVQSAINATSATTGSAATVMVWQAWAGGCGSSITGTATTTGNIIWQNWNDVVATHGHRVVQAQDYAAAARRVVTPEERARRDAEIAAYEVRIAEERKFRLEAEAKAEILLQRLLTTEQRETLKEKRCFYLHTGGKKYRIDRGQHGNVKLLDAKDQIVESYCIQPKGGLPDAAGHATRFHTEMSCGHTIIISGTELKQAHKKGILLRCKPCQKAAVAAKRAKERAERKVAQG